MINRRQFVLAKKRYCAKNFSSLKLQNGYFLSYHNQLNVYHSKQKRQGILIGFAWQTAPERCAPIEELNQLLLRSELTADDIYQMEQTWCGRYVLIIDSTIYLDATGMLGVFYSGSALSSSYSILCDVLGIRKKYPDKSFGIGMGFQPGIYTMHKKIRRLLPSQIYNYSEHKLLYRQLLPHFDIQNYSKEQTLELFIRHFICSLHNMRDTIEGTLWISLTGGHDSRTLMALLEHAKIPYKCFTLEVSHMNDGDKYLPEKLAKSMGRPFIFLKRNPFLFSARRMQAYIKHSNGFAKDEDALSYSFGQYDRLAGTDENAIILRSGIWGIVMEYFRSFCNNDGTLDIEKMKKSRPQLVNDPNAVQSLIHYLKYLDRTESFHLKPVDRYHWEIRVGCWLSSVEQSCDMIDNTTFLQPCNSRIFLALLKKLAEQETAPWEKCHEENIIQKSCPALSSFTFDKDYPNRMSLKNFLCNVYYTFLSKRYFYGTKNVICSTYRTLRFIQQFYGVRAWIQYKLEAEK